MSSINITEKPKHSTEQLRQQEKHVTHFTKKLCPKYGMLPIENWGEGSKNKKENCDADITVQIIGIEKFNKLECAKHFNIKKDDKLTVSLKTKGGAFTIVNGGTTTRSGLFNYMTLGDHTETINKLKIINKNINQYKKDIWKNNRWEDVGQEKRTVFFY